MPTPNIKICRVTIRDLFRFLSIYIYYALYSLRLNYEQCYEDQQNNTIWLTFHSNAVRIGMNWKLTPFYDWRSIQYIHLSFKVIYEDINLYVINTSFVW